MKTAVTMFAAVTVGVLASAALTDGLTAPAAAQAPAAQSKPAHAKVRAHSSREMQDRAERRETTALNLLEAASHGHYTGFRRDGNDYRAEVMQNGERVALRIDPDKRTVTPIQ